MSRNVAVLRPEPGNATTAARAEALGLRVVRLPLFEIVPIAWQAPDPAVHDALLLTSTNAIRHGGAEFEKLRSLPVLAVGERTAEAARDAGFRVMASGESDAAALLAIAEARGVARALHLGGRERSVEQGGPVSQAITVYASERRPIDPQALAEIASCTVLLHSARAAAAFADLIDTHGLPRGRIAALSPAVAKAAGQGWARVAIAEFPTDPALLAAATALFD